MRANHAYYLILFKDANETLVALRNDFALFKLFIDKLLSFLFGAFFKEHLPDDAFFEFRRTCPSCGVSLAIL